MNHRMTQDCPLCSATHDERTALRIHLEVEHRKSEIVSRLLATTDRSGDDRSEAAENEQAMSAA